MGENPELNVRTSTALRTGLQNALVLLSVGVAAACGLALIGDPRNRVLLPRELLRARNCLAANATEFAMNFGMFGLSFMLALYAQQILHYSAVWSAVALRPISIMLLLAERFGRLTAMIGTKAALRGIHRSESPREEALCKFEPSPRIHGPARVDNSPDLGDGDTAIP